MFEFYASNQKAVISNREPLVSGSVNVYEVKFSFSEEWEDLNKYAVFQAVGSEPIRVPVYEDGEVIQVPWECLTKPSVRLLLGAYGTMGDEVIIPTVFANMGVVLPGVPIAEQDLTPTQALSMMNW